MPAQPLRGQQPSPILQHLPTLSLVREAGLMLKYTVVVRVIMPQHLHRFHSLQRYRVSLRDCANLSFHCFWFDRPDTLECRISHIAVGHIPDCSPDQALVPVNRVLAIDGDHRVVRVDMSLAELTHGGPFEVAVAALKDRPAFCSLDVEGSRVRARDGDSGRVVDFLVDTRHWDLRYFELAIGGRETLVDPAWANEIDPAHRRVLLDLPVDAINDAPEFKSSTVVNPGYCEALYRHYTSRQYMH
jgi:hypothetical protein